MNLKIEYDDSLSEDLAILQTKKYHSIIDKISAYFYKPYQSNIVIGYKGMGFSPRELYN